MIKYVITIFLLLLINITPAQANYKNLDNKKKIRESIAFKQKISKGYIYNPNVSPEVWNALAPYFLPDSHPIKAQLDDLFTGARIISTKETLMAAGFQYPSDLGRRVIALKHPKLPKYIIKLYTDYINNDHEASVVDWQEWLRRIEGARIIREGIKKLGYEKIMIAPHKWIYPLPANSPANNGPGFTQRNFILIAEDMNILSSQSNHKTWRKKNETRHLDALYTIVTKYGLRDSCRVENTPWTQDKKRLAFVDTEYHGCYPVNYHALIEFLSTKNKIYWKKLQGKN